jgi:hypothetical protein
MSFIGKWIHIFLFGYTFKIDSSGIRSQQWNAKAKADEGRIYILAPYTFFAF